jgi:CRISPR system Cascade subunit CasA
MLNVLNTPLIRALAADGAEALLTLPGTLAALARGEVATFPGLRSHQRHAWHAFLCQLGALALLRAGESAPWTEAAAWREALRALTPDHPDDAPWCLVAPPDRPALLQPPIPEGLPALRNAVPTPDTLDMLVASRNHDLKAAVMAEAGPDDWLFALVTLQTMEGFLGAGNYGISRMNGGFASRPALSLSPPGGPGEHFARDVVRLVALRGTMPGTEHYAARDGLGLLWLEPWDGTASLPHGRLDPLYVEVCRRVRLVAHDGRIAAVAGGSKAPRVLPTGGGLTGDPWAPVVAGDAGLKVFTLNATGFHYRRMVQLMWSDDVVRPPLLEPVKTDAQAGLTFLARALVRGQGKTEGYHERRVPLSRLAKWTATDPSAERANERVRLAGQVGRVLRSALLALFQGGPERVDERDEGATRKAQPFLDRLDAAVDVNFFPALWREVEAAEAGEEAARAERARWVRDLLGTAANLLDAADEAAPKATRRRLRARVAAQGILNGMPRRNPELAPYLMEAARAA